MTGDADLGRSVQTVLFFQLWRTLRKAPTPNPKRLDFRNAMVRWLVGPLEPPTNDAATALAAANNIRHVLWGEVTRVGKEALVTAYLSIPNRPNKSGPEVWSLVVGNNDVTVTADLPERFYAFHPVVLSTDFVANFGTADGFPFYSAPRGGNQLGVLGVIFERIHDEGDVSQVKVTVTEGGKSVDKIGWVRLPKLSEQKPEIIDFLAGIIRVYREDWQGAIDMFELVLRDQRPPTALKIDSLLLIIRAKAELGLDADEQIKALEGFGPLSQRSVRYVTMYYLAQCHSKSRPRGAACPHDAQAFFETLIRTYANLFAEGDSWLVQVARALQ
jgi:hypothetical protein